MSQDAKRSLSRKEALIIALLFALIAAARFCHTNILWVEEAYPTAAARQMMAGKFLYRDIWFDKPPLYALVYLMWDAEIGAPLRLGGTLFIVLACSLAYRFALDLWGRSEAIYSACLLGLYLTFGIPSAVMALAPDLLMLVPHIAAVYLAWKRMNLGAGLMAGVAFLVNAKGLFVLAACLLWAWQSPVALLIGFALPCVFFWSVLWANNAVSDYYQQVWQWGLIYSKDSFVANPLHEGFIRTAGWLGFESAAVIAAIVYFWKDRTSQSRRFAAWLALSLTGVAAGLRFFPRYFFQALPSLTMPAARGLTHMRPAYRRVVLLLLLVPALRFGPRYVTLASDLIAGRQSNWSDISMNQDSQAAAAIVRSKATKNDTLLVWGYRPDVFCYSGLAAGTRFLDSQPLTGVIADRHLIDSRPSAPEIAGKNRAQLVKTRPTFIVDGLGPYNPALAISNYPDLKDWLTRYRVIGKTGGSVVYQLVNK